MEIVLAALVAAAVSVAVVLLVQRPRAAQAGVAAGRMPKPYPPEREERDPGPRAAVDADDLEEELRARRAELARLEERLRAGEQSLELRTQELDERQRSLEDRQ